MSEPPDDPSDFLDNLAAVAETDAASLDQLAALFEEARAHERAHPPDRAAVWSRVSEHLESVSRGSETGDGSSPGQTDEPGSGASDPGR